MNKLSDARRVGRLGQIVAAIFLLSSCFAALAQRAQERSEFGKRVEAAMASDMRGQADKDRDANRKPVETLEFFGLRQDMRVLELFPAAGWYTKLLGPALAEDGHLYTAFTNSRIQSVVEANPELAEVEVLEVETEFSPTDQFGVFSLTEFEFPVDDLDAVLTFRNVHNFTTDSRALINAAVYRSLKPGGIFGIVDHTRRHNEPGSPENWRRIDPISVIHELEAAGFEFVNYSNLHYRPDDELRFDTARNTVKGNSDRFTLLFRKPE